MVSRGVAELCQVVHARSMGSAFRRSDGFAFPSPGVVWAQSAEQDRADIVDVIASDKRERAHPPKKGGNGGVLPHGRTDHRYDGDWHPARSTKRCASGTRGRALRDRTRRHPTPHGDAIREPDSACRNGQGEKR